MDMLDDAVGSVVNTQYDLVHKALPDFVTNMTLLSTLTLVLSKDKPFPKTSKTFKDSYDYIIVGAGPAGCVMANRLTQKECVTVLLLEAGGDAPILTEVPAIAAAFHNTNVDWGYITEPQKNCAIGQKEHRVPWYSGKGLGGGSIFNAMLYVRGNKDNYNDWEKEGCTGWGYKDVLTYFKKSEDNLNLGDPDIDSEYHGGGKPMAVEKPKYGTKIRKAILEATEALGYGMTDSNGERQTGMFPVQAFTRKGLRCSTAKAYLVPAENRPNLTILKRAYATKILMNGTSAYGVEFDFKGKSNKVLANKEVIISAGTVRTAQMLMLAGIGPKEHLKKFNIPCVVNSPVGKNLQDHCAGMLNYELSPLIPSLIAKLANPVNVAKYLAFRTGIYSSASLVTLLAFLNGLNTTSNSTDFPRQEIYFSEYSTFGARSNINMKPEYFNSYFGPYTKDPFAMYACIVSLLQPRSRGEILLNSTDPHDHPLIDPKYYENKRDLKDVVEGMKICQAIGTSPALKKIGAKPFKTTYPGCKKHEENDDKYYACMARSRTTSFWHPVGTARMGSRNDSRSVVDPQLRVIGVNNLRVVNAAVMPIIPSGNTQVATMMIAEKAYDMMKDDINCI